MNQMEIFKNPEFGSIRTFEQDGKVLFCGTDVATALGYANPRKAVRDHTRCGTKCSIGVQTGKKADGTPAVQMVEMLFIPEGDVYRLIVHSKLPAALEFERWVFDEVLPAIHRHGGYLGDSLARQIEQDPAVLYHFAEALLQEREKSERLEKDLLLLKPKADYFDAFVEPGDSTNIRATAKELDVPERLFCRFLQKEKYLYRAPAGNLMPYAGPFQRGFSSFGTFITVTVGAPGVTPCLRRREKMSFGSVCPRSEHGRNENVGLLLWPPDEITRSSLRSLLCGFRGQAKDLPLPHILY